MVKYDSTGKSSFLALPRTLKYQASKKGMRNNEEIKIYLCTKQSFLDIRLPRISDVPIIMGSVFWTSDIPNIEVFDCSAFTALLSEVSSYFGTHFAFCIPTIIF